MKRTINRALALAVTLAMLLGMMPSAMAETGAPPAAAALPPVTDATTPPAEGEAPPATLPPAEGEAPDAATPLAARASTVPALPTVLEGGFVNEPTIETRFLAGDGKDAAAAFPLTEHSYSDKAEWNGTIDVTVSVPASHTARELVITAPKDTYITDYTKVDGLTVGATVTVDHENASGKYTRQVRYALEDSVQADFRVQVQFSLVVAYPSGRLNPSIVPYPLQQCAFTIDYATTEDGAPKKAYTERAASTVHMKDAPNPPNFIKQYSTQIRWMHPSRADLAAGAGPSLYPGLQVFIMPDYDEFDAAAALQSWSRDTPAVMGYRMKITPSNPNVNIINASPWISNGDNYTYTITKEGNSFVLEPDVTKTNAKYMFADTGGWYSSDLTPDDIYLKLQGENVPYAEVVTFTIDELSLIGRDANGEWTRLYEQPKPTCVGKLQMLQAPRLPTIEWGVIERDKTLYFSDTKDTMLRSEKVAEVRAIAYPCETIPLVNPRLTVALPDGLRYPMTMVYGSSNGYTAPGFVSYDDAKTWTALPYDPENDYTVSESADGKQPTHVYFVPDTANTDWVPISFKNAGGYRYRNGDPIVSGDKRPYTITFTADNLAPQPSNHEITYQYFNMPTKVNRLRFTDRWSSENVEYARAFNYDYRGEYYKRFGENLTDDPENDDRNLFCSGTGDERYRGTLRLYNEGTALDTIEHTNATIVLKPGKYVKLLNVTPEFHNTPSTKALAQVTVHMSDGTSVTRTQEDEMLFDSVIRAPKGESITSVEYLFSSIRAMEGESDYNNEKYANFHYEYSLLPEGLQGTDAEKDYFSLSFAGSDQVKPAAGQDAVQTFKVSRSTFRGMDTISVPTPYMHEAGTKINVTRSDWTSGGIAEVSDKVTWQPLRKNVTDIRAYPPEREYRSAVGAAEVTVKPIVAYKISPGFRYVNGSANLKTQGPTPPEPWLDPEVKDIAEEATWTPRYFPDGSGLLHIEATEAGDCDVIATFRVATDLTTETGTYTPIEKRWHGGDFARMKAATGVKYAADTVPGATVSYDYVDQSTESAIGFDLNGDGAQGTAQNSVALTEDIATTVNVTQIKQEGIYVYGSGVEDNVEGGGPFYGKGSDTFTYRTFILGQLGKSLDNLVMYLPIPRAGKKPASNAATNEWDAQLTAISGSVLGSSKAKYTLQYTTAENPPMGELSGTGGDGGYVTYDPANPPDLAAITMLKIKANTLTNAADDIELSFTCKGAAPQGAVTNHMESYYRYTTERTAGTPVFVSGPTRSIDYTLASSSVSGTVYLDGTYDGLLGDVATTDDMPLAGIEVTLYDSKNAVTDTATTDAAGKYVLEAPRAGQYYVGVAPTQSATRRLIPQGAGSAADAATGKTAPFDVTRNGVQNKHLGYRDAKSFRLYRDGAHTQEITSTTVLDVAVGTDTVLHQALSPAYLSRADITYTASIADKLVQIPGGKETTTLRGTKITEPGANVTMTATMDDGFGGTVSQTFLVRVLPSPTVALFENEKNYYTQVLYEKDSLLGGITFKNGDSTDFAPQEMWLVPETGAKVDKSTILNGTSHTFTDADIGKYEIVYRGTDAYGRPVVDGDGNEKVVRTIYIHGYPYLKQVEPYHSRVGGGFDPKKEADGQAWLTATHKHANPNGSVTTNESFSAEDGALSLAYYKMYSTAGTDPNGSPSGAALTALPATPGKYEVYYYARMRNSSAYIVSRTLYLHGAPAMYVPTVISMKPNGAASDTVMDIDYAANIVWQNDQLRMYDLVHVNEDGSLKIYNRANTKFYDSTGKEITSGVTNPDFVTAGPVDNAGGIAMNVFIKDGKENIKNIAGVYPVTMAFRDTLDNMGKDGLTGWETNKKYAYNTAQTGMGYIEMPVDVVVTTGNLPPVLPNPAALITNFVQGDSTRFTKLAAPLPADLAEQLARGTARKYTYDDGTVDYYKADAAGTVSLTEMLKTQLRFQTHDLDIHEIKSDNSLTEAQYKALHAQAVAFLWESIALTKITTAVPGQEDNRVIENPTSAQVDSLASAPGSHTLTFTADDVRIEKVSTQPYTEDDTHKKIEGYWIVRDTAVQSTQSYHFYVHSDVTFSRTTGQLVSYGLHVPESGTHTEIPIKASFVGGKLLETVPVNVTVQTPDISKPNTAPEVVYQTVHPIASTLATARAAEKSYRGTAFVNDFVKLRYRSPSNASGFPALVRQTTGAAPYDLRAGVSATMDGYADFRDPAELGTGLPTATWTPNQPVTLTIYDAVNLHDPLASDHLSSSVPSVRTIVYKGEHEPDAAHPYHNAPNVATERVQFIFDTPISLAFGAAVSGAENKRTMTVLRTATDADIRAALAARATVTYGETPSTLTALATTLVVARDKDGVPTSVTVTATDKSGNKKEEVIALTTLAPPVITIALENESGNPLGATVPDITTAVIGMPYTVYAPHVSGYALAAGQAAMQTITVREGSNLVHFRYAAVTSGDKATSYSIDCLYNGAVVQHNTLGGIVGQSITQTAVPSFINGTYQYTLQAGEPKTQTHILVEDAAKNVFAFRYDRTEIPGGGGGGGGGGGTDIVNYYAVNYIAGTYGALQGAPSEQVKSGTKPQKVPGVKVEQGYTFKGWFLDEPTKPIDPAQQTVTQTLTFYAAYTDSNGDLVTSEPSGTLPALNRTDHIAYLHGDDQGKMRPDAPISRAEVVVIFSRLLAQPMPQNVHLTSKFRDVPQGAWYREAVAYMEQFGMINGYEDGTFRPDSPISRAELTAIAARFDRLELTAENRFRDVPQSHWAAVYINSAAQKGWLAGYEDGTFRPNASITRAETAKVVNALLGRAADEAFLKTAQNLKTFPDLPREHWAYAPLMEAANAHTYRKNQTAEQWLKLN